MRPDQLPHLLDHSLVGLYALSGDRILWVNARAAELLGCKPEEMAGGSFLQFVYPPDWTQVGIAASRPVAPAG